MNCPNCTHSLHDGVCEAPIFHRIASDVFDTELVGICKCDTIRPSAVVLSQAADQARDLDELLSICMSEKMIPLVMGFDLDYLADIFEQAAERLSSG